LPCGCREFEPRCVLQISLTHETAARRRSFLFSNLPRAPADPDSPRPARFRVSSLTKTLTVASQRAADLKPSDRSFRAVRFVPRRRLVLDEEGPMDRLGSGRRPRRPSRCRPDNRRRIPDTTAPDRSAGAVRARATAPFSQSFSPSSDIRPEESGVSSSLSHP
jgi:hypothetical protein